MRISVFISIIFICMVACSDNSTNSNDALESVKIGNNYWAKFNLDVVTYRNGDAIPQVTDTNEWKKLTTGAWCYHNNDPELGKIYGKLYNWYAINDPRGLAPTGFHVATDDEWKELIRALGGADVAGGKLKSTGTEFWSTPNKGATNSTGFSALPGGARDTNGSFLTHKYLGAFWTSTQFDSENAFYYGMSHIVEKAIQVKYIKKTGCSVRCVKDQK
jgi:uncharacterized protein (TIGR02145 family)